MTKLKTIKFLSFLILFTFWFLCYFLNNSKVQAETFNLRDYIPLEKSKYVTKYLVTFDGFQTEEVSAVSGTEVVNGVRTYRLYHNDANEYECLLWENNGLKLYKHSSTCSVYLDANGNIGYGAYTIYTDPLLAYPSTMDVGETSQSSGSYKGYKIQGDKYLGTGSYNYSVTLEAVENVEVPAGNFQDCLKFTQTYSWEAIPEIFYGSWTRTIWFAKNIGCVKSVWNGSIFCRGEINTYTRSALLKNYTPKVEIISTDPYDGETEVFPQKIISVYFNQDMDPSTLNPFSFLISASPPIAGKVFYDPQARSAHFLPNEPLLPNTTYTATISTSVMSVSGASFEAFDPFSPIHWTKYEGNLVLQPDPPGSWDAGEIENPSVIKDGNIYKMWYTGEASEEEEETSGGIGYATSTDGIHWTKYEGNPVLTPGPPGSWDYGEFSEPHVLKDGERYLMWYEVDEGMCAWDPAYSPDGTQIVFTSDKNGNPDIWIMNADGSNPRQITHDPNIDWDPAWSPDGSKIAFGHEDDSGGFNIWVINVDGTNLTQLTFNGEGTEPAWSPDGSKIACDGIWVMDADGTNLRKIVDGVWPSWSPDGTEIAFGYNDDIWIANADGSNPRQITTDPAQDCFPSFSPDGTKIAFCSNRSGYYAIWTINVDGTDPTEIVQSNEYGEPQWSADGTKIAYEGDDGGIWVVNADGSNPVKIMGEKAAIAFAWSTDGINWIKHNSPVLQDAGDPWVIRNGAQYKMWYCPEDFEGIGCATSPVIYGTKTWSFTTGTEEILPETALASPDQPAGEYHIFSVPLRVLNPDPLQVFGDDLGPYDPSIWRLFWTEPETEINKEYPNVPDVSPGIAYWLITRDGGTISASGSLITDDIYSVEIPRGWFQLGNPYNANVPKDSIMVLTETATTSLTGTATVTITTPVNLDDPKNTAIEHVLWGFENGSYVMADELVPWGGCYIHNVSENPVTLIIKNPVPAVGAGSLQVTVLDAVTGDIIEGATVTLNGFTAITDELGIATIENTPTGTFTLTVSKTGYITYQQQITLEVGPNCINVVLSPQMVSGQTRIVLTWGETPPDLDSHLTGPLAGGERFHVYYVNQNPAGAGANLDVDDTTSYGPETITITEQRSGTYKYYVHDFTNQDNPENTALAQSGARVDVYREEGLIASYQVPSGTGTIWHVFNMDGDTGEITPVNTITYGEYDEYVPLNSILMNRSSLNDTEIEIFRNLPSKPLRKLTKLFGLQNPDEWSLQIFAKADKGKDFYNFIGVSKSASPGYDHHDLTEPPIISGGITLYFPHFKWGDKAGNYATDFRPLRPRKKVFQFVVESPKNTEVEIGWPNIDEVPDYLKFTLVDLKTNGTIPMNHRQNYLFNSGNDRKREFQIIVRY